MNINYPSIALLEHPMNLDLFTNFHESVINPTASNKGSEKADFESCEVISVDRYRWFFLDHDTVLVHIFMKWIYLRIETILFNEPVDLWSNRKVSIERLSVTINAFPALFFVYFNFVPVVNESIWNINLGNNLKFTYKSIS